MVKSNTKIIEGPIFTRLFLFTVPIILTGLLQVAYNIADNIVVGRFSGDEFALAAVGSTTSLTTLIVNFLMGIATGAGVVIAQAYGAGDEAMTNRALKTAMTCSIVLGVSFSAISFIVSKPVLTLMGTKPEAYFGAVQYFRIICLGIPATTMFNFGNAAIRSLGNSRFSLYVLGVSGIINVILNLFFVIVCGMSVEGVALATVISQYASAFAVLWYLSPSRSKVYAFNFKTILFDRGIISRIVRIGLPAGLQSSLFSLSNIVLTSAANTLPTAAVSAKTISFNVDGMVYTAMNSFHHSTTTYIGQNFGAKKPDRIKKALLYSIIQVTAVGFLLGQLIIAFSEPIVSLYLSPDDPNFSEVMKYSVALIELISSMYFLCGIYETINGALRGLGNSIASMIIGIVCTICVRLAWVYVFFPMETFHTLNGLYYCYPITWVLSILSLGSVFVYSYMKFKKIGYFNTDTTESVESASEYEQNAL